MKLWGKKGRPSLEKINNVPVKVTVGRRSKPEEIVELSLREPTMMELMDFIETSVGDLSKTYSKEWAQKMAAKVAKGNMDAGNIKLLTPAFVPICGFIARCADQPKLELDKIITPAQFLECFNALLYLVDAEVIAGNFSEALAKTSAIRNAMKRPSSTR